MKKRLCSFLLAFLLLSGCSSPTAPAEADSLHILATTYPVYLFATALTENLEHIEVSLLVNSQTSCLHDYTLTVKDMKDIEQADVILLNGAGLEEFMDDPLRQSQASIIDCSTGLELLPASGHHHDHEHNHSEEHQDWDPHFWMAPEYAIQMVNNLAVGLKPLLVEPSAIQQLEANQQYTIEQLNTISIPDGLTGKELITFHDGFHYFADSFGLDLLKSIEEEEGSTASAREIKEIVSLVEEYHISAIFVEKNGADATAKAISRETGCTVYELNMLMSGDGQGIQPYLDAINGNLQTISEAFS